MPITAKDFKVPHEGDPSSALWAGVGEQPGRLEVFRGRPFVGPAGREADNCFRAGGLLRSEGYLTNAIDNLSKPLSHYIRTTGTGKNFKIIVSEEGANQFARVREEVAALKTRYILAFGNVAMYALTNRWGINKWRGSVIPINDGRQFVVPTYHPSTLLPDKGQYLNKHCIIFDMKRLRSMVEDKFVFPEYQLLIEPSLNESLEFLDECAHSGEIIHYDLEVTHIGTPQSQVACISFAYKPDKAISIPLAAPGNKHYFDPNGELKIIQRVAEILQHPDTSIGGQNLVFDCHFLLRRYGIRTCNIHDTMIAQNTMMSEYPKGLDFITSIWTEFPYYKDDGKFWLGGMGSWNVGWQYNALDSLACCVALPRQLEELDRQDNMAAYNRTRHVILPLTYMMERGFRMDVEGMALEYEQQGQTLAQLEAELNELVGRPINPRSPDQLKHYFYKEKNLHAYKWKGKVTTNEMALKRISRLGHPEAKKILEIRGLSKERGTYLDTTKIDDDGRMRCAYNPAGTRFSRLSSKESIFGTGNNLQNQPHHILKFFLPDKNYVAYEVDYGQAENRIVAYVGKVEQMIEAFEKGMDVHALTAALISGLPIDVIKEQDRAGVYAPMGGGDKTWRFWGKKANHGLNYDLGYKKFALYYEIPERDARTIVDRYHRAYPGIRQQFHHYVQTSILSQRFVQNLMGRKTFFLGDLNDPRSRDETFKAGYSCIPQGTVGDLINDRALNFAYYNDQFYHLELLGQVHDSIKFQIPLSIGWRAHAELLIMLKRNMELPIRTHYGRAFSIPIDLTMGRCFDKSFMAEFDKGKFSEDPETLANSLEAAWEALLPITDEAYKYMWR
jgi:uracil-DNA glycosylase family 4